MKCRALQSRRNKAGPCRPGPRSATGFTLIELTVAMFLVAILSLSLYASLRIGFKARQQAEAAVEPPRTGALVLDMIGNDLSASVPPVGMVWGNTTVTFEGTDATGGGGRPDDDVVFFSVADSPLHQYANGDVKSIELTVVDSPDGHDHLLVRKVNRNLLSQQTTPNPDVETLCRGVGEFNLRYYNGSAWADAWDSTQQNNTLPAAVEVTLTLERPDGPVALSGGTRGYRFVRIVPMPCSTAAQDSTVNPNATQGLTGT